jgi:glycosyltransferase involved in cell wall biosynthesis
MAGGHVDISVVLSTYNRAAILPAALDALLAQHGDVPYEVIVVDNNSTDGTGELVRRYVSADPHRVRYLFEPRQGLSYGRNTGIAGARAPIVAFTDDDGAVASTWIERLKRAFDEYPDCSYVGGRVLPRWSHEPPRWLTTAHWSPLALQDYGERPIEVGAAWPVCLVGANLAFRREVFDRVGMFESRLGRIKDGIGSTEDHEMQLRIWRAGLHGVYVPDVLMAADVPPNRMTRAYHDRWHREHGRHCAQMRLREHIPQEFAPMRRPSDLVTLFGAPAFVYAEVLTAARKWLGAIVYRRDALFYANRLRHLTAYIAESWRMDRGGRTHGPIAELWRFLSMYARKAGSRLLRRARQRQPV